MRWLQKNSGQGLLETVFAIGILLIVVVAVLALATSNVVGQKESESQVIANNLAREGIEVARNIRDSNWLAGNTWSQGLTNGNTAIASFDLGINDWSMNFSYANDLIYQSAGGVYSHNSIGGTPTRYRRVLTFANICLPASGLEYIAADCIGDEFIGLKIESKVEWLERGKQRKVILEDLIYAWK